MTQHKFTIPIGDWSGDGHGQCEYFQFASNLSLQDVREAYFAALDKHEDISPEGFCNEYQDCSIPQEVIDEVAKLGFTIDKDNFYKEEMADYVAWFCTLGNPELKLERQEGLDMLPFYGYDKKKRHIGFVGYGFGG